MKFFYFKNGGVEYITAKSFEEARNHQKFNNFQGRVPYLYEDKFKFVLMVLNRGLANDEYISSTYYLFAWRKLPNKYGGSQTWLRRKMENKFRVGPEPDVNVHITSTNGVSFGTLLKNYDKAIDYIMKRCSFESKRELYENIVSGDGYLLCDISRQ